MAIQQFGLKPRPQTPFGTFRARLLERLFPLLAFAAGCPAAVSAKAPQAPAVETAPLSPEELGARQRVYFDLKMRNFGELQARIAKGEVLSPREMTDRYLPTAEVWREVAAWASANGYSVERSDDAHMTVFAASTVGQIQASLRVPLARFSGSGEIGYAPVAGKPSLPAAIEDRISGVIFPQPRHRAQVTVPPGLFQTGGGVLFLTPQIVAQAYGASGLGLDGTGQTIVVLGGSTVNPADLTAFWTNCGLPATASQFTEIDPFPQLTHPNSYASEETKDIEWSSAMAPKARILYISSIDPEVLLSVLMPLLPTDSTIHQVNISWALSEAAYQQAGITPAYSQYYAALAALGITVFSSSGDYGSTADFVNGVEPTPGTDYYDPSGALGPDYPASDPYVTGVGGTAMGLSYSDDIDGSYSFPTIEGGWCLPDPPATLFAGEGPNYNFGASTGGISLFFPRPTWQAGVDLPTGGMRCSPDVAAIAASTPNPYAYFNGEGGDTVFQGTSMSSPVWSGLCALLNQARANAGLPPLGLLGPHIYPLMGTPAFFPMITGSQSGYYVPGTYSSFTTTANNGAYGMGAGYNLVTGLGSPDMPGLVAALIGPVISQQPQSQTMASGSDVTFAVNAAVPGTSGSLSYQWQFQGGDLSDGTANGLTVAGSQGPQLLLMGAGSAAVGDYVCVVTFVPANSSNFPVTISTNPASLTLAGADDPGLATSISTRAFVGTGDNILIGGFYIVGSTSRTVLVQALGPALTGVGVSGALQHPTLSIHEYQSGQDVTLYSNTGWGSSQVLLAAAATVFATPVLAAGSADSELLVTLPPGGYSAEVGGADGGTGVALCAIYELP